MTFEKDIQRIKELVIKIIKSNPPKKAKELIKCIEYNGRKIPNTLAIKLYQKFIDYYIKDIDYEKFSNNESKYNKRRKKYKNKI